jgi:hypothetical protein
MLSYHLASYILYTYCILTTLTTLITNLIRLICPHHYLVFNFNVDIKSYLHGDLNTHLTFIRTVCIHIHILPLVHSAVYILNIEVPFQSYMRPLIYRTLSYTLDKILLCKALWQ